MATDRISALRSKVLASAKITASAKAAEENARLRKEVEAKKEELQQVLRLKEETKQLLSADPFAEENETLRKEVDQLETQVVTTMEEIEALVQEEEPNPTPTPNATPEPTPESKGNPPDDGGAIWQPLGEEEFLQDEEEGACWVGPEGVERPCQFWGPKTGVTKVGDAELSTHFRLIKR